jgi:predicted AlkP superfamily pyrophosphatase or phosphodiesterase
MPSVNLSPANGPRRPTAAPEAPGLVLLKIDGLSYRQMQRALGAGRLPYLGRLMATGAHRLVPFYSGVPSATPAVQAELFYGVRGAVRAGRR